jgi:hypothetical protein
VRVDAENVGVATAGQFGQLGLQLYGGKLWALYRDANVNKWTFRTSTDGGATWSAPFRPTVIDFAIVGNSERAIDLHAPPDASGLYVVWRNGTSARDATIKFASTVDGTTWTTAQDTGIDPGEGWGTPSPRFRVQKTASYWHFVRYMDGASLSGQILYSRVATLTALPSAEPPPVIANTGGSVFAHEAIQGLDLYQHGLNDLVLVWDDSAESVGSNTVHRRRTTDEGATWGTEAVETPADPPSFGYPAGLHVPAFNNGTGEDDVWSSCNDVVNHIHVIKLLTGAANQVAVYGPGISTGVFDLVTVDVSDRVRAISLQKDADMDANSFDLELANTDGHANLNDPAAVLYPYCQPNARVSIEQWHGDVANAVRTFTGIQSQPQQSSDGQTVTLVGLDRGKKFLKQQVILTAPQELTQPGYVRNTGNYVYLNKTLNEVLDDFLIKAGLIPGVDGIWAATSYVFKELKYQSGSLMTAAKAAAAAAGMLLWNDEDGIFRTAPVISGSSASTWTYRTREDITELGTAVDDDSTVTRVQVIGRANIGAKYLQQQFAPWPSPAAGPRGIAYDKTTQHVWMLCANKHLYRLDPRANMGIVSDTDLSAWLAYPDAIDVGPDGHLWIADGFDATLTANANRKFRKVDRAAPGTTLLGPFTNPDQLHVRLWHDGVNALWMDTYASPSALVKMNDVTGAEISRVVSPVNFPMGFDSDGQGGALITGLDQVDMFQIDLAGNIVNRINQAAKNSNEFGTVRDAAVFDNGDVYACFVDQDTFVKYASAGTPTGVLTATLAEVVNSALEAQLDGEKRYLQVVDLNITDLAMAYATAVNLLTRASQYRFRTTVGVVGHPGTQLNDRVTLSDPAQGISSDWVVRSIRSDQIAAAGTYLAILQLEPFVTS